MDLIIQIKKNSLLDRLNKMFGVRISFILSDTDGTSAPFYQRSATQFGTKIESFSNNEKKLIRVLVNGKIISTASFQMSVDDKQISVP